MISTPEQPKTIEWTHAKFNRFRKAFCQAYEKNPDMHSIFTFEDNEFVLGYAGYLIEYLGQKFGE